MQERLPKTVAPPAKLAMKNAYIIMASPIAGGAGRGMVAARDIPAGAIIIVERPVLVQPQIMPLAFVGPGQKTATDCLFERLSDPMKAEVMRLHNCKVKDPEMRELYGILHTNSLGITLSPSPELSANLTQYAAVFLKTSMVNHR